MINRKAKERKPGKTVQLLAVTTSSERKRASVSFNGQTGHFSRVASRIIILTARELTSGPMVAVTLAAGRTIR